MTRFPFSMPYNTKDGWTNTVRPSKNMQKIILFVVFLLGIQTLAQDKPNPPPKAKIGPAKPIKPVTRYPSELRRVGTTIYGTKIGDYKLWVRVDGLFKNTHLDGSIIQAKAVYRKVPQKKVVEWSKDYSEVMTLVDFPAFIRNFPKEQIVPSHKGVSIRCVSIGTTEYDGKTIQAFDCGVLVKPKGE